MYGSNLGFDSPFIAVVATGRMREELGGVHNGIVHRYGAKKSSSTHASNSAQAASKHGPHEAIKAELDPQHTHFILVDGPQEGAKGLRNRLEYYLSSQDVPPHGQMCPRKQQRKQQPTCTCDMCNMCTHPHHIGRAGLFGLRAALWAIERGAYALPTPRGGRCDHDSIPVATDLHPTPGT